MSAAPDQDERDDEDDEDDLTDEAWAELEDRAREAEEHPERLIPHEQVMARLRAKLAG